MIPVRGFEGRTVAVFGLARTGLAAARALQAGGAKVALWDEKPAARKAAEAAGFAVTDLTKADSLHHDVHQFCFIARSVNFPIGYEATYVEA